MADQQQQQLLSYDDNDRTLPLPSPAPEPSRPSWDCVMDIDSELLYKRPDCPLPSLKNNNNMKKKQRRSVSFQTRSLLFRYDVPEDEPQDWYTDADEDMFKAEAKYDLEILKRMKEGLAGANSQQHNEGLCIVGLEQQLISPEFMKKRARTKKLVNYAVLLEQSKLRSRYGNGNSEKAERIAEAARQYSEWSAVQAKMFGDFQHTQSKQSCWLGHNF